MSIGPDILGDQGMRFSLQLHPLLSHDQTYGGAFDRGSDIVQEIDNVRMSLLATAVCSDSCRRSINVQLPRGSSSEIAMRYVGGRSQNLPVRYTHIGSLLLAGCLIAASVRRNRRTFAGAKLFFCNSTYWYRDGVGPSTTPNLSPSQSSISTWSQKRYRDCKRQVRLYMDR